MDYFTTWPEAFSIPDQEATTVAEVLVQQWVSRFGTPLQVHSDQGTNFPSAVFKGMGQILGIDKTQTTPLHPQSDGMVERFNRTILNNLSLTVSRNQQDWDLELPLFLLAVLFMRLPDILHRRCSTVTNFVCLVTFNLVARQKHVHRQRSTFEISRHVLKMP